MGTITVPTYRKRIGYQAGLLGGVALVASAALVIGNLRTQDDIAARAAEDLKASLSQVLPDNIHDNDLLDHPVHLEKGPTGAPVTIYVARQHGEISGIAFPTVTMSGYSGAINLIMGVDPDGKVLGVRVVSHSETPGLGDKIEETKSHWILSFNGLFLGSPPEDKWKVKKDGGYFDQFSGATITPRAVVKAIKQGLEFFEANRDGILHAPAADTVPASNEGGS